MRNNHIVNSSIIINIIVNGKNESKDELPAWIDFPTEAPTEEWNDESTEKPFDVDPGYFIQPQLQGNPQAYQQPDIGLLKVDYRRPPFMRDTTTEPS